MTHLDPDRIAGSHDHAHPELRQAEEALGKIDGHPHAAVRARIAGQGAAMARQAPRVLGTRSSGKVSDSLIGTAVLRCGRERKNIPEITIMLQRAAANTPERERRPLSSRRRFPGASTYHAPL